MPDIEPWMERATIRVHQIVTDTHWPPGMFTQVKEAIATAYAAHLQNVEDTAQRQALWRKTKSVAREQCGELRRSAMEAAALCACLHGVDEYTDDHRQAVIDMAKRLKSALAGESR